MSSTMSSTLSDESPNLSVQRRTRCTTIGVLPVQSQETSPRRKSTGIQNTREDTTSYLKVPLQMRKRSGDSNSSQRFEEGPALPDWKVILDTSVKKDVNTLFQLLLTDSQFYRSWLVARKSESIHNVTITDWKEVDGKIVRTVNYNVTRNFGITSATISVSQKFTQTEFCVPGSMFGVNIDTTNTGLAYADSFILREHYRLTADDFKTTHMQIVADIEFVKSTFLKGRIEAETWSSYKKTISLLHDMLDSLCSNKSRRLSSAASSSKTVRNALLSSRTVKRTGASEAQLTEGLTSAGHDIQPLIAQSETWRTIHSALIILILILLTVAVYKVAHTLEVINHRLSNIEKAFLPKF